MEEQSEYDQSLEDSLAELDQEQDHHSGNQSEESEEEEGSQQEEEGEDLGEREDKAARKHKKKEQQHHDYYAQLLNPDQDVEVQPPLLVVVQGSTNSGKTSVIRSLVKHYTNHKIDDPKGPITLRSTKKQRITLLECPNDLTSMIDLSKIADIVVLVIDASLSFEMETFEFLSLLKSHGFPHVMGVLTHLDFFKENKQLRKTRKRFKKRFEHEVGGNSKLFPMSKLDKGLYPKVEAAKLARYIGTSKPPPFPWRNSHPYLLADRWIIPKDLKYRPNDEVEAEFYGYMRGCSYRVNGRMHLVGLGDFQIKSIEAVTDPCPEFKKNGEQEQKRDKTKGDMEDEEGGEEMREQGQKGDADVAAISQKRKKRRTLNQNERIIYAPNCNLGALHFDYSTGYVTIPQQYVKFTRNEEDSDQGEVEEGVKIVRNLQDMRATLNSKLKQQEAEFQLFEGVGLEGQETQKPQESHQKQFKRKQTEMKELKNQTEALQLMNPHEQEGGLRKTDLAHLIYESKEEMRNKDCCKFRPEGKFGESLRDLFVTGMETDRLHELAEDSQEEGKKKEKNTLPQPVGIKASISQQTNFFKKGLYVKVLLSAVKYEAIQKMKPQTPVILSRINLGEDNLTFLKVRFKRHRWYKNLLKSNDPLIVSSGWRRYQTLPVFCTEDANQRMRYLKYTPQHDFCYMTFYGNFTPQDSGCVFMQTIKDSLKKFRIAGTGVVLEMNRSFEIAKKIKLVGQPYKIMKNTAFIKGMFNSSLEVAGYIGAQIRTVSGIRGQVKKNIKQGGEGVFRATFQDKISMSDLVFCRAWYKVILERYYSPILSFGKFYLMKTKYELRSEKGAEPEVKFDSEYKTIDRAPKIFTPFQVPKKLQAKLPFKTVEKVRESKKDQIRRAESQSVPKILQGDKEREVAALIQRMNTIKHMKEAKREENFKEKQRLREARDKPRKQYYENLKKEQKAEKMAGLQRKRNNQRKRQVDDD